MIGGLGIAIERGRDVRAHGRRYVITHVLDLDAVMAQDMDTGRIERLPIADLRPYEQADEKPAAAPELSAVDERDWDTARRRLKLIEPFLNRSRNPSAEIYAAAEQFGIEGSTLYRWMRHYRATGTLTSLLPNRSKGGQGKPRLPAQTEEIVKHVIEHFYLTKQQPSLEATYTEVVRLCREAKAHVPHRNTVRARVNQLTLKQRLSRRAHRKQANDLMEPRPGEYDAGVKPLSMVQIDHTELNIMLVDEQYRQSIGRPWLTIALDVYSRMVLGFVVSLDSPGSSSTGLCLTHAILPKEAWLAKRNIANPWPCWGFPGALHLDNAKEFRGEMVRRACEQYGIALNFRPLERPRYGGHIERLMGTLSTILRPLDGATFSSPAERGEYDSEGRATMTITEFECWFAEYITGVYHQQYHSGIRSSPIQRWRDAILGNKDHAPLGVPARPDDEDRIRLDFMPLVERTIQPYGIEVDHVFYYSDVLREYLARPPRNGPRKFIFRRDPRDVSVIYFWHPDLRQYAEVPYRNPGNPPISLWELRALIKRLVAEGRAHIDEEGIFEAQRRLRTQQEESKKITKQVRRHRERSKAHARRERVSLTPPDIEAPLIDPKALKPFEIFDV